MAPKFIVRVLQVLFVAPLLPFCYLASLFVLAVLLPPSTTVDPKLAASGILLNVFTLLVLVILLALFWKDLRFWRPSGDRHGRSIVQMLLTLLLSGIGMFALLAILTWLRAPHAGDSAFLAGLLCLYIPWLSAGPTTAAIWWRLHPVSQAVRRSE